MENTRMSKDQKPKQSQASKTVPSCSPKAPPGREDSIRRTQQLGSIAQATLMTLRSGIAKNQLLPLDQPSQSNALTTTEQLSPVDLALLETLDQMTQVYKTEILPGEVRVWKNCFSNERPEAIRWGFRQYFKDGIYPPKPADIAQLIRRQRESPYFDGWDADIRPRENSGASEMYRKLAKQDRDKFFSSPEYKAFLERMKKDHGI